MFRPFRKVLVANRGEIACRVLKTARAKGFSTVAVVSEVDVDARHATLADEVVVIGPAPVGQSYLDAKRIIDAAERTGADAIHPGYGFLSERAEFAEACVNAGLVFIGPAAASIRAMGDKSESKRRMIAAGVPCIPGYEGEDESDARLTQAANEVGYPIMVKASAGGGGRGIRLVNGPEDLAAAIVSARSEAKNAFGDDRLLLERAVVEPRHIEIQVFGDTHGNVVHLGERDCSVQRRHQKVVEEAPSPAVDPALRERMGSAAVQAARAIDYVGAGTVEFLLDQDGNFYFLEMNTRLQVEHPVTEIVTGLDLVALQFDVAAGRALPISQKDVKLQGHAIEVRLYAEDADRDFMPQTGKLGSWRPSDGVGVRTDHGLLAGATITQYYDSMIAKVISGGTDREEARRRLVRGLRETRALGVVTNKSFLMRILEDEEFKQGAATTGFIQRRFGEQTSATHPSPEVIGLAAILAVRTSRGEWQPSAWVNHPVRLECKGERLDLKVAKRGREWQVNSDSGSILITLDEPETGIATWSSNKVLKEAPFYIDQDGIWIDAGDEIWVFRDITYAPPETNSASSGGDLHAPMVGTVAAIHVKPGDRVVRGAVIMVIEAMKMEHSVLAKIDGVVRAISCSVGTQVSNKALLASIEPENDVI
ncbi:acetyl/propionyl/methylcrotonyl-CoA carboxylase subunit alpha [Aquisediminimonas profunda]|uniref:acetyl/propionyl/methylcrotonyl-CoA carboxylase subunit alpha n=1 Tax=Aquisediminimonas profunda TaxID=1550733 RepID=UPI001C62E86A|nr:acetyl/propionyl/methylcrotonyl-CoA carboxylase subunit alpha [Aquisediminimonas profunda]